MEQSHNSVSTSTFSQTLLNVEELVMLKSKLLLIALPALAMSATTEAMAETVTRYEMTVDKNVTADSVKRNLGAGVVEYKSISRPAPYVVESKTTTITRGPSNTVLVPTASSLPIIEKPMVVEKRVIVEKPVYVDRPVIVEKQVFVDKPVVIERVVTPQQVITPQPVIFIPRN